MRRGVRLRVVVAAGFCVAVAAAAPGQARVEARSRPVPFRPFLDGSVNTPQPVPRQSNAGGEALVFQRSAYVDLLVPQFLGEALLPRFGKLDWRRSFLIGVATRKPTTGYTVRIRKISLQRVDANTTQFCVIAAIRPPGANAPVERRPTTSFDVVTIRRAGFGLSFTPSALLRDDRGKLLSRGRLAGYPVRPTLCRA